MSNTSDIEVDRQNLLHLFRETAGIVCIMRGPQHVFEFVNESHIKLLNKNVTGMPIREAQPDSIEIFEPLDEVYRTGKTALLREWGVTIDGEKRFFNITYSARRNARGDIDGVMSLSSEVTNLIKGREALQQQRQWLEGVLDKVPTAFFLIDPATAKVTFINRAGQDMMGIRVLHTLPKERYGHNYVLAYDKTGRLLSADEIPSARAIRGEEMRGEYFLLHTPVGEFDVSVSSTFLSPSHGFSETAVLLIQDVTALKKAEQALRESETRFRFLADTMPQIVWTARKDGVLNYTNKRWTEYSGSNKPEEWGQYVHPDDLENVAMAWGHSICTGEPYEAEFRLRRQDQTYRSFLVRAFTVNEHGEDGTCWYGTCTDVTEQKALQHALMVAKEQAEYTSELKSSFLANMSHEIRTPLAAILGFTDLLRAGTESSADRDEYLEVIGRNGKALMRIIDDILDLSKIEADKLDVELAPFSFSQLLQEVMDLFKEKILSKKLLMSISEDSLLPDIVVSDAIRLRQVLINIIGNAVKFTDRGRITIHVEQSPAGEKQLLTVRVRDTGPGLTKEQRNRLFQPFTQAENSVKRQHGGTGLGLALSRRLARALGGDVTIGECDLPEGCEFIITIAASMKADGGRALTSSPDSLQPAVPQKRLNGVRVLAVDDARDNRVLIGVLLRREGADIEEASSGEEAIQKALHGNFDVVLMDIQMPGMDGREALSILRNDGYLKPVIALSAHAMKDEIELSYKSGFAAHVTKPVTPDAIVESILKHVAKN